MLSIYSAPGNEHEAVVEFAPYQKVVVPKEGRRRDPKLNTLDQDPDYLKFLEFLAAGPEVGYKDVTQRLIRLYGYRFIACSPLRNLKIYLTHMYSLGHID
jgi:hypothetical protein